MEDRVGSRRDGTSGAERNAVDAQRRDIENCGATMRLRYDTWRKLVRRAVRSETSRREKAFVVDRTDRPLILNFQLAVTGLSCKITENYVIIGYTRREQSEK